jgi:hypothetical protein
MNRFGIIVSSVVVCAMFLAIAGMSRANDLANAEPLPAPGPVAPSVAAPSSAAPAASTGAPDSCCGPCIEYRHHGRPICCCDCNAPPEIKTVLHVKNPSCCCGCTVDVPVCLPGCCTGEPCVSGRCGVLGRGVVHYEYACGVRVTVTFKACGDILVTYLHA